MSKVIITGWNPGLKKVSLTKVIRRHTGFGLARGKQCTDEILENKSVVFRNLERSTAERLLEDASECGAVGKIEEDIN
jgi:ribosomal protein L7/L12